MNKTPSRIGSFIATALLTGLTAMAPAQTVQMRMTEIAAQPLNQALSTFAKQTGLQLIYVSELASGRDSKPIPAGLTVKEALTQLLAGTSLAFEFLNDRTVRIFEAPAVRPASTTSPEQPLATNASSGAVATFDNNSGERLEEIVVTAQKKEERVHDVPVPVTAIDAGTLVDSNQLRIQDYYTRIPGLSLTPGDVHGAPILTIRGVTTGGFSNPTVGITVDDVPSGSSTNIGGGYEAPDFDPSELTRVEVLRGPQGTLYGASSIGGLLKFVTVDPSLRGFSGRVQGGFNAVHNGDGAGYSVRGAVNVPLSEVWAIRASGFTRRDAGYIDDPALGIEGVNRTDANGGRLSALWRPSQLFSLKLSALLQHTKAEGSSDVEIEPGLRDLQQNAVRGTGFFNKKVQAYSATATADIGSAELTSVSAYGVSEMSDSFDYTFAFGDLTESFFPGVRGTPYANQYETKKFSQEFRLSTPIGARLEWLAGAFYTYEQSQLNGNLLAAVPQTGEIVGASFRSDIPTRFAEVALFTDLTFKVTDRFDIQVGGRESQNRQSYAEDDIGPLVGGSASTPKVHSKDNSFTYLVTPRFKVSPDVMLYARLASGYRAGGPNPNSASLGLPAEFGPDKTQNYEIGIKADTLDHALSFDASVYSIDWKDIQLQLDSGGFLYYVNASRAKSQGIELSVVSRPLRGLEIAAWVAWNDAELTEDFPHDSSVAGRSGDRLPGSARLSGNLSVDEEFPLGGTATGFVGASVSYVGDRKGNFTASDRQTFPSFTQANLRAGARYESWTANLFVNNLTDRRGVLAGGLGTLNELAFKYIQPRTVGVSLAKNF